MAPFIETYRPSEYRAADGSILRRLLPAPEPFPLSWPSYVTFIQPELERLLRERAREFSNLEVRLSSEVVAVSHLGGSPALDVKEAGVEPVQSLRCRYVVGCDGAGSFLRKAMSIDLEDLGFNEPWLVLDILLTKDVNLPETNIQFCDPARPATFVRGPGALRRWEFMIIRASPARNAKPESVWQMLRPWLRPDQGKIWRSATYRFHALVAETGATATAFSGGCRASDAAVPCSRAQSGHSGRGKPSWKMSAALQGAPNRLSIATKLSAVQTYAR